MPRDGGYAGPLPNPAQHPHLRLDETMTSVPKVNPGDMVFWHCVSMKVDSTRSFADLYSRQDVVHAVEQEHTGTGDSAGKSFNLTFIIKLLTSIFGKSCTFQLFH